ncbi:hypothetical protein MMC25_007624 [Agyrium rufum]|nr:hypothetical protein [Agyrium rufum]
MASLPKTMRACQVVEYGKPYKLQEVSVPTDLAPHDLLVKVAVASLCHTDFMVLAGAFAEMQKATLPQTGSYEGAGTIVAMGDAIDKSEFSVGDRVCAGITTNRCGECRTCKGDPDRKHYCLNNGPGLGIGRDGAFAEYLICDARESNILPKDVSLEAAGPLACAGRTVYRGVIEARLKPGEWLGLVGSGGGLGHIGIQFAKALGLKVVGVNVRDEGLALSKEMGADLMIDARSGSPEEVAKQIQDAIGQEGCDATVNLSDAPPAAGWPVQSQKCMPGWYKLRSRITSSFPFHKLSSETLGLKGAWFARRSREMRCSQCLGDIR